VSRHKNIYFVSDLHLGLYPASRSREREKLFVQWLTENSDSIGELYLLGDIFDFWWEYKKVVPRGFTRFLGAMSGLTDRGIAVHFFTGNHDLWVTDYLQNECGITVHRRPFKTIIGGKKFFIAHGDGVGKGDYGYKLLRMLFHSRPLQWLYSRIHPNLAVAIGHFWAKHSRYSKGFAGEFKGESREHQICFAREILKNEHFDYFVFGHRHIPLCLPLNDTSVFVNTGDWLTNFSYGCFDGTMLEVKKYSV